jgi:hypothetical protein
MSSEIGKEEGCWTGREYFQTKRYRGRWPILRTYRRQGNPINGGLPGGGIAFHEATAVLEHLNVINVCSHLVPGSHVPPSWYEPATDPGTYETTTLAPGVFEDGGFSCWRFAPGARHRKRKIFCDLGSAGGYCIRLDAKGKYSLSVYSCFALWCTTCCPCQHRQRCNLRGHGQT